VCETDWTSPLPEREKVMAYQTGLAKNSVWFLCCRARVGKVFVFCLACFYWCSEIEEKRPFVLVLVLTVFSVLLWDREK
jgi:hypothetical protein